MTDVMNCWAIGVVRSLFKEKGDAPSQGRDTDEISIINIASDYRDGLDDISAGEDLFILCWFDQSDRTVLKTRKRRETDVPLRCVFSTRSPAWQNPSALTLVKFVEITDCTLRVRGLETLDGTPVLGIKRYYVGIDTPRES